MLPRFTCNPFELFFHCGIITLHGREINQKQMGGKGGVLLGDGGLRHGFGFIDTIQAHESADLILIAEEILGIDVRGVHSYGQGFFVVAEARIRERQIIDGTNIARIDANPLLIEVDGFF